MTFDKAGPLLTTLYMHAEFFQYHFFEECVTMF